MPRQQMVPSLQQSAIMVLDKLDGQVISEDGDTKGKIL